MKIYPIAALALILLVFSCDEDSFSQTVEIPIPEHEPLPVLSLDLRAMDSVIYSRLGLSRGILEENRVSDLVGTVELFRDGTLLGSITSPLGSTDGQTSTFALPAPIGAEGGEYRLVGNIAGFPQVEATQTMPAAPVFSVVSYEEDGTIDAGGYRVDELVIDITDNANTEDYYAFRVQVPQYNCRYDVNLDSVICDTSFARPDYLYLDSPDPLLLQGENQSLLVTDQSFNGRTFRVRIQVDNYQNARPRLEVLSLTEDAYRYAVSRKAYIDAGDNPFAEPVNVHNNVTGGYGYFILSNRVLRGL